MEAVLPTLVMIPGSLCNGGVFKRQKRALRGMANVVLMDYSRLNDIRRWAPELLSA